MNIPGDLPECVRGLIRPRLLLRTERDSRFEPFVGVWGGTGAIPLPRHLGRPGARHWMSLDCFWMEEQGFGVRGCMSVYRVGADFVVLNEPELSFDDSPANGLALFGFEEPAIPDVEVLDAYLPEGETATLMTAPWAERYFRLAQEQNPLFRSGITAVLGGWHVSWPDGLPPLPRLREQAERVNRAGGPGAAPGRESFRCEPYRLMLWTLRDAEPWVEVWGDGTGELHGVGRIT